MKTILAIALILGVFSLTSEAHVNLRGHFKEDQSKREGLAEFLYGVGLSFFKRTFSTSSSWEHDWLFKQRGNEIRVSGKKVAVAFVKYRRSFPFAQRASTTKCSD